MDRREQGNVAITTALALVPLLALVGLSVDAGRAYLIESKLSQALDAAGLAGGRVMFESTRDSDIQAFFNANFPAGYLGASVSPLAISADANGENLAVSVSATMPTSLAQLVGTQSLAPHAATTIHRAVAGMELVLVMDNTGSMQDNNKIGTMKQGATDLVNILFGANTTIPNVWVSLVPYTAAVNIGPSHKDWLDATSQTNLTSDFSASPQGWKGCVEARWKYGRDSTDDPPAVEKWVSFKYPKASDNVYPPVDESTLTNTTSNNGTGPNLGCPPAITPMLADKNQVLAAINAMGAWHRGGTMANLGLAWGWRLLSPRWRGLWSTATPLLPLDYNAPFTTKVAVLLTDGVNEVYDNPPAGPNGSDYTAYDRLGAGRMGSTDSATALANINAKMANVCAAMKAQGIVLYTITYQLTNTTTKALFSNCASKPEYYYDATDNSKLIDIFHQIGVSVSKLRIAQ